VLRLLQPRRHRNSTILPILLHSLHLRRQLGIHRTNTSTILQISLELHTIPQAKDITAGRLNYKVWYLDPTSFLLAVKFVSGYMLVVLYGSLTYLIHFYFYNMTRTRSTLGYLHKDVYCRAFYGHYANSIL
jgi:hypothetical protein